MNRQTHRYMQTVQKDRNKFYLPAQKILYAALLEQIKPVIAKVTLHSSSHSLEHLIKDAPMIIAFKSIYTQVGNHFARAQYFALLDEPKKNMKFKDDDEPIITGPHTHLQPQQLTGDDNDEQEDSFTKLWRNQVNDFVDGEGAEMVTNINDATRNMIKDFLADAIKNGTSASDLAGNLRDHWTDLARVRSMTIARNEVNRAQNFATNEGAEMTGLELVKTWVHSGGGDTDRQNHLDADGMTVDFDESFNINADYTPMYPHDGSGDASDEINCNCTFYNTRKK
jgi:F like protein